MKGCIHRLQRKAWMYLSTKLSVMLETLMSYMRY